MGTKQKVQGQMKQITPIERSIFQPKSRKHWYLRKKEKKNMIKFHFSIFTCYNFFSL